MKKFHFTKTYFKKTLFDEPESKIRIVVSETPSIEVEEESYSLRLETRHEDDFITHRNYAIEHHLEQKKHNYPHLQFKFHDENIGTIYLKLQIKNSSEYEKVILGFIYKLKSVVLNDLEKYRKGITEEILIIHLVEELINEGKFLDGKIKESLSNSLLELKDKNIKKVQLKNSRLLNKFLGIDNIKKIKE